MNVLDTMRAQRILKKAQEGGFFDDLLGAGWQDDANASPITIKCERLAARASALLSGEWENVGVDVTIREFKAKNGVKGFRLHFKLY